MNKKKIIKYLLIIAILFIATPVLAETRIASCDGVFGSNVWIDDKIPHLIHLVVTIIKIVVPILIIIFGMIDFVKAVTGSKDDTLGKAIKSLIRRLIAAALVFLVFAVVQLLVSALGGDKKQDLMSCMDCFINEKCSYK